MAGYAIPMDRIGRRAVETLKQGKEIEYGLLGIRGQPDGTEPDRRGRSRTRPPPRASSRPTTRSSRSTTSRSSTSTSLILAVNAFAPGDEVRLKIRRDGKEIERTVVLAKFPVDGEIDRHQSAPGLARAAGRLPEHRSTARGGVPACADGRRGGRLARCEPDSPAAQAGLKKCQVIRQVEGKRVAQPAASSPRPSPSSRARSRS